MKSSHRVGIPEHVTPQKLAFMKLYLDRKQKYTDSGLLQTAASWLPC